MICAIFDANVLASGFVGLSRAGASAPAVLLRLWMIGRFTLIVSEPILAEVERSAFANAYFQRVLPDEARAQALATLRKLALISELVANVQDIAPDPDDDHVLSAALSSEANYIVTGDQALRSLDSYAGIRLVTPREFLEIIETYNETSGDGSTSERSS